MKNLKKIFAVMVMTATIFSMTACGGSEEGTSAKAESTDAKAEKKATVKEMKGADLQKIEDDKDSKEEFLVIDVRSEEEYDAGHVKFAINMPIDTFESNIGDIEDWKDKSVVTVCNSGKKSGEAADILVENGFTDVANAEGIKSYEYDLVTWGNVRAPKLQEAADEGTAFILDMRDAKDFEAGHFKDAVNADPEDVEAVKDKLPKDKGEKIITHCYSGNKSAVAAQALVDMGYTNVFSCLDGTKEVEYEFAG